MVVSHVSQKDQPWLYEHVRAIIGSGETVTLQDSKLSVLFGGIICLSFTVIAYWALSKNEWPRPYNFEALALYGGLLLFGVVGIPASVLALFRPARIDLLRTGFRLGGADSDLIQWTRCSDFQVVRTRAGKANVKLIAFRRQAPNGKIKQQYLVSGYGRKYETLAALMNMLREAALQSRR